jgi:hypothetical protein
MARIAGRVLTVFLPVLLCLSPGRQAAAGSINIPVMTQNLYLGANTDPLFAAKTLPELQTAIVNAANSVNASNFPLRSTAIAAEAANAGGPLLIGLQEAEIVGQTGQGGQPQILNYADTLVSELNKRGLNYTYLIPGVGAAVHTGLSLDSTAAGFQTLSA